MPRITKGAATRAVLNVRRVKPLLITSCHHIQDAMPTRKKAAGKCVCPFRPRFDALSIREMIEGDRE